MDPDDYPMSSRKSQMSPMGPLSRAHRPAEFRDILFWLLLLGSWQFLAARGLRNAMFGAVGTAAFLISAWWNLGELRGLGLAYACWQPTTRSNWTVATLSGIIAGIVIFGVGSASGQDMMLSNDWTLVLLQLTLGPVLEEVVFRGYLVAFLMWLFGRVVTSSARSWLVIPIAAVVFAVVHLAQPGVSWLQLACITSTGSIYGWIRLHSGSTAAAAVSHAAYNLALYAATATVGVLRSGNPLVR